MHSVQFGRVQPPVEAPFILRLVKRRSLTNAVLSAGLLGMLDGRSAEAQSSADWAGFKQRFVTSDGRVVDTGNNGVSHSEGQSYGMLFAVFNDDQATFDSLKNWTSRVLQHRADALHSWRYVPNSANHVPDTNNATDGDLGIALALSRAATRWGRPEDTTAAVAIAQDIR